MPTIVPPELTRVMALELPDILAATTVEAAIDVYLNCPQAPKNQATPWTGALPPLGTWRFDPVLREFEILVRVPTALVTPGEPEDDIRRRCRYYPLYVQWTREGRQAPPVTILVTDKGNLHTIGRRRTLAAKEAGLESILGWLANTNPDGGCPWRLQGV